MILLLMKRFSSGGFGWPYLPIAVFMPLFVAIFIPILLLVVRKRKMELDGTWMGAGSIQAEETWRRGTTSRRTHLLQGIVADADEKAQLASLQWSAIPPAVRRLIFERKFHGKRKKQTP